MNILIIDTDSCGLDLAYRCAEADHKVRWFMPNLPDGSAPPDGNGFPGIEKVKDWKSHMKWAKSGLIVHLYNNKYLKDLDQWKQHGFPVFAPSFDSAKLEINRGFGMEIIKKHGVDIPNFKTFKSLKDAEAFAMKADQSYVFKTLGDEEDKSLSYVASSPADLVARLRHWQKMGIVLKGPCMLQEKIDMIAEMGVSGWFGPEGFLPNKWNENFEHKKLMPGDFGPNTGEMGTVMQYVEKSKLAEEVLLPFEDYLKKAGHVGDIDMNCGIDSKGKVWPFEFTCRFGYPSTQIMFASHRGDPAKWMKGLIEGKDLLNVDYRVATGVIVAQPEFPYAHNPDMKSVMGNPIYGIDDVWEQISPWQMMIEKGPDMDGDKIVEKDTYQTAGEYICVVTGHGKTVSASAKKAYDAIDKIKVSNMIVRNDIGQGLEKTLKKVHPFDYAKEMEY